MIKTHPVMLLALAGGALLSGCTTTKDYSRYSDAPIHLSTMSGSSGSAITAPVLGPIRPDASYANRFVKYAPYNAVDHSVRTYSDRIEPQDLLDIEVYKVPDLSKSMRVDNSGTITMPLIGAIRVVGLTAQQLEAQIASRLSKDLMVNPQVKVLIKEAVHNRITVEGVVKQPGVFPANSDLTLLQAIALAGGLVEGSDAHSVMLYRKAASGQTAQQQIDLASVRRGYAPDVPLLQDDRIVVLDAPLNQRVVVEGEVKQPGVFPIRERMTVLQAIALAGGSSSLADNKNAVLLRYRTDGRSLRYRVDLESIRTGRAADPELMADDRLVVLRSDSKYFVDQAKGFIAPISLFK